MRQSLHKSPRFSAARVCSTMGGSPHDAQAQFRNCSVGRRDLRRVRVRAGASGEPQYGGGRLSRLAGAHRLSARHPETGRALDRLRRPSWRQKTKSAQRPTGKQRHVAARRDRSPKSEIPRAYSGRGGQGGAGRRADGARVQRRRTAERRQGKILSAARIRQPGARNLGHHRSRAPANADDSDARSQGHAQKLVGMRHRHRLSGRRRAAVAQQPHDADIRFVRPGEAGVHPLVRAAGTGTGRERPGTDHAARRDIDRPAGQSRVFRLRHERKRRAADRRSRQAAERPGGADAGEHALSADRAARSDAGQRRAHRISDARRGGR